MHEPQTMNDDNIPELTSEQRNKALMSLLEDINVYRQELEKKTEDLQKAMEALEASRTSFYSIVEKSADGTIVVNSEGAVRFLNKSSEMIFGKKREEYLGEMFGLPVVAGEVMEVDIIRHGGEIGVGEMRVVETEWEGESAYLIMLRDITDRKQYEESLVKTTEELKRLDQIKSDFISTASHELRTPLTSIKNAVDLILSRKTGEITDAQEKFLFMAQRNVNRLSALINDLLDISRIESGKIQLNYTEVDIKNIIENVINTFRSLANEKSISLKMNIAPDLPPIYADAFRIEQVLINLVNNAIKFTPDRGKISVQARLTSAEFGMRNAELNSEIANPLTSAEFGMRNAELNSEIANPQSGIDRNFIEISVTDTGIGIPEEHVKHLFEKFYQVESSLSVKKQPGSGLGLAISKGIVKAHGGKIECKSKEGGGSTFSFTLPIISTEKRFYYMLKNEIAKARQYHLPLSVLIIKLEDFVHVKEVYGIKEYERLLEIVKEKIEKKGIKVTDTINVSRYNGEIIVLVIMPDTDRSGAQAAQKRIKPYLTGIEIAVGESKYNCTFTSGVATYPDDGTSAEELLVSAIKSMNKSNVEEALHG